MDTEQGVPPSSFRPPLLGDRYVVRRRVGRGGTSSVYVAYDVRLHTWRAVKVMHVESASDADLRERFVLEGAALANLEHPNIVRVVDVQHDVAIPYLVMEWLEGGTAAAWVKQHGPMPIDVAIDVMLELAAALEFVHSQGVIHRDVNPRNLLIDRAGICKLTDFGIARVSASAQAISGDLERHTTEIGTVMGTDAYMAPEQRRDSAAVDLRADLYAAGATMYTLLTGRLPPDLAKMGPADPRIRFLPPLVAPLVVRLCSFRPDERHEDAAALRKALLRLRKRLPPSDTRSRLVPAPVVLQPYAPRSLDPADAETLSELIASGAVSGTWEGGRAEVSRDPSLTGEEPEIRSWRARIVVATSLALAALAVVLAAFTGVVAFGAHAVGEARWAAAEAEERYLQVLDLHRTLAGELNPGGTPAVPLVDAYRRFDGAPPSERAARAEHVYQVLIRSSTPEVSKTVVEGVSEVSRAHDEFQRSVTRWRAEASRPAGWMAVTVGIATGPPTRSIGASPP